MSFCAPSRVPRNPRDLRFGGFPSYVQLIVRRSSDCPVFFLVSSLPSASSAGDGTPPWFAGFSGTIERPDSLATCMSGLRLRVFSDRSVSIGETDAAEALRLPRERFPAVHVVSDPVRFMTDLPLAFIMNVALPLSGQGRPPQRDVFGAQYTARLCFSERFAGQSHPVHRITRSQGDWLGLTLYDSFIRYLSPAYAVAHRPLSEYRDHAEGNRFFRPTLRPCRAKAADATLGHVETYDRRERGWSSCFARRISPELSGE